MTVGQAYRGLETKRALANSRVLYIIGTEGREIYNTFNVVEGEQNKLQSLFDAFDGYCKPKENTTVERCRFNLRNQSKTETIDQYITELRVLAKTCKLGNLQDELLRDRIVCGICNDKLKERLLRDDKLTLDKTIDICRAAEESQKYVKMFGGDENLTVNKINRKPNQKRFTGTPSTKPESHIKLSPRFFAKNNLKFCIQNAKFCKLKRQILRKFCNVF